MRTLGREIISTRQEKLAKLAQIEPKRVLTTLAHHIDEVWLREAYRCTRKDGAVGVDGVTAAQYEADLEAHLASLLERFKSGRYRAPAVRRVHIPKPGKAKKTRPIGIPTLEDKVLQRAVLMVLEPVYEQDFLDRRVRDGVIRRAIGKWLNAGVMESGEVSHPDRGTPQGGVISPVLSNLYLHEVLDVWFEHEVKPRLLGRAFEIRFADDAALVFEREEDARRVLAVLSKRFAKHGLHLHPEKTRLVDFRSPPRAGWGGSQRERSFGLLGFTHYWGRSRKGRWVVQRKTAKDRFTRAIREVGRWCQAHRHWPVAAQQAALHRKLKGHYAYYGITGNGRALACFLYEVRRLWRKWLHRRSWRGRMTWEKFGRLVARYPLPQPRVVHSICRRAATP